MTLKQLLNLIGKFQDFQLVNAKSGEYLSRCDYLADSGCYENIELYMNNVVYGIGCSHNEKTNYLIIMLSEEEMI